MVEGYHDKLMSLTERIVKKIVNFQVKEDRFSFVKVSSRTVLFCTSNSCLNVVEIRVLSVNFI